MEIRKVQLSGGSSYILTLPKEWIKASGIKKNDPLAIINQADGSLLITPRIDEERPIRRKEINATEIDSEKYLLRLLIGSYITGHSEILIKSKGTISPMIKDGVMKFIRLTIGTEIIDETDRSILVKDLLNPAEMPLEKTIRRMHNIVKNMHRNALKAIRTGEIRLVRDSIQEDENVDRLYWLIARQYHLALRNRGIAAKLKVNLNEVTYYFLIGRILERVGDHAVRIAENVSNLMEAGLSAENIAVMEKASEESLRILDGSMDAWRKKDIRYANENRDNIKELEALCDEINTGANAMEGKKAMSVARIAESIRRTGEYSGDIAEMVINHLIDSA